MGKRILALLAGLLTGVVLIAAIQIMGMMVFPPPAIINPNDEAQFNALLAQLPLGALVSILIAWAVGTFGGAFVAAKIVPDRKSTAALSIGVFFMAMGINMLMKIPHPHWMTVIGVLLFLPSAWLGGWAAKAKPSASNSFQA